MMNLSFNPNIPTARDLFWEQLAGDEMERLAKYKRGWLYYYGQHDAQLKVKPGQPDDNVILNLAQYAVDLGVDFLFGQPVTCSGGSLRATRWSASPSTSGDGSTTTASTTPN